MICQHTFEISKSVGLPDGFESLPECDGACRLIIRCVGLVLDGFFELIHLLNTSSLNTSDEHDLRILHKIAAKFTKTVRLTVKSSAELLHCFNVFAEHPISTLDLVGLVGTVDLAPLSPLLQAVRTLRLGGNFSLADGPLPLRADVNLSLFGYKASEVSQTQLAGVSKLTLEYSDVTRLNVKVQALEVSCCSLLRWIKTTASVLLVSSADELRTISTESPFRYVKVTNCNKLRRVRLYNPPCEEAVVKVFDTPQAIVGPFSPRTVYGNIMVPSICKLPRWLMMNTIALECNMRHYISDFKLWSENFGLGQEEGMFECIEKRIETIVVCARKMKDRINFFNSSELIVRFLIKSGLPKEMRLFIYYLILSIL